VVWESGGVVNGRKVEVEAWEGLPAR
jgi:hypothetical protein